MKRQQLSIYTGDRSGVFDITADCQRFVAGEGDGLLTIFVPHATAGLVVMELGSGSEEDLLAALQDLLPRDDRWRHSHGSTGHGADHVLPLLVPPTLSLPVSSGELQLGTWQSVALLDTNPDNPSRAVHLSFLSDEH
ncbi:secondary thiamine-phosphate synthase enzyme YjbQ [soil metagenome]